MLNKNEAKEMAKYIALGVSHYNNITDQTNYIMSVLERYNLVEKIKLNDKVMGNHQSLSNSLENVEDVDLEQDMAL